MVPGTYQYKFVGNPASDNPVWMLDPANAATESGNSAFLIALLRLQLSFPPSTGAAGQCKSCAGNRKTYFIGGYPSPMFGTNCGSYHIG